jgi:hypothetical protein
MSWVTFMYQLYICTSLNISFVSLWFSRDLPGLDSIVLTQSFLVLDDPFLHFFILYPLSHN